MGSQIDAGRAQDFAYLAIAAQRTLHGAALQLVLKVKLARKPSLKGMVLRTTQVKNLHAKRKTLRDTGISRAGGPNSGI